MKNVLVIFTAMSCVLLFSGLTPRKSTGRTLVWSEEFNYTGTPDSTKWNFEEGPKRGIQKQYYTKNRLENASVENGILTITARKEEYPNPNYYKVKEKFGLQSLPAEYKNMKVDSLPAWVRFRYDSVFHYTSASMTTLGKLSWKYGRIEARAKVPQGKGVSSAIWMLGSDLPKAGWPKCGEIDIMEFVGQHPNEIHGNVHYGDSIPTAHFQKPGKQKVEKAFDDFHVYAIEWNKEEIKFFCDDILYNTFLFRSAATKNLNPFHQPFYLIVNLAIGSGNSWSGPVEDRVLPQKFAIDYIRVYQ